MITIEASNIYFGGGFTLLSELLNQIEKRAIYSRVYIGYSTIADLLEMRKYKYITFTHTNKLQTLLRYANKGENTLFFCSLPPFTKYRNSIVYSHNPHILSCPMLSIYNTKFILYHYWLYLFKNNVDYFACQTETVSKKLQKMNCKTELLPFYTKLRKLNLEKKYDFCYISTVAPHKNHDKLFDAIELAIENGIYFTIIVTIRNNIQNFKLIDRINQINQKVGKEVVINRGFVNINEIEEIYGLTRTIIFPSLDESFGLPLIEAANCGLRVISADKAYTHDLLNNPIVFNPEDSSSIKDAIVKDLNGEFNKIEQSLKVEDKIENLITYLNK